ncbi:MAG: hypothetical protein ACR2FM_05700 [Candidatus Saccharimonadales bacterium]
MSERLHDNSAEYEALAPQYLEILERLSDNEALKYAFYSMSGFFEDYNQHIECRIMMEENDPDAKKWAEERYQRSQERFKMEEQARKDKHFNTRVDLSLHELVRKVTVDGRISLKLADHAVSALQHGFDGDWWYPTLHEVRNDKDELVDMAMVGHNNGATSWLITTDDETGQLRFGDKFHGFKYNHQRQAFTGVLGAGEYPLDHMGMGRETPEESPPTPDLNSKHVQAVRRILES